MIPKNILANGLRSLLLLSTSLAVLCSSFIQTIACGGYADYDDTYYIMPLADAYDPDQFSWHYTLFGKGKTNVQEDNLSEWVNILKLDASARGDIKMLYFDTDETGFLKALSGLENGNIDPEWKNNQMLQALNKKKKNEDLIEYLKFSKSLEKELNRSASEYYWDDDIPHDTSLLLQWFQHSSSKMNKVKNKELKFRYAYQTQRLAFHMEKYDQVIELYERKLSKWNSSLRTKALSNKFGALWRIKEVKDQKEYTRTAEMILDLYDVFHTCSDCPIIHYQDLSVLTAEDFFLAEKQLKSAEDKCKLWEMAAYVSVPVDYAFRKVASIDPNSKVLEILMSRQIVLWEKEALNRYPIFEKGTGLNQPEMAYSLNKLGQNDKVENQSFWLCQLAFYHFLRNDNQMALQVLFEAESVKGNKEDISKKANHVLTNLIVIRNWTKGDLKSSLIAHKLEKIKEEKNSQLLEFALRKIEKLASPHDYLFEYEILANAAVTQFHGNFNLTELERLEKSKAEQKTPLLKFLWANSGISDKDLLKAKASWYLNKRLFTKALNCLQKANDNEYLQADPFIIHLVDCHDCDIMASDESGERLNRIQFTSKVVELKKNLSAGKNIAQSAFLLGNALYNMTEYGNNRPLNNEEFNKSDLMHPDYREPEKGPKFNNGEPDYYTNMAWASYYYNLAIKSSKDSEFKAKMHFLLAKCEQNKYYNREEVSYMENGCDDLKNLSYRANFKKLGLTYSKTKFYQEALKECSYFEHYTKVHLRQ